MVTPQCGYYGVAPPLCWCYGVVSSNVDIGWCGFSQCGWDGVVSPSVDGMVWFLPVWMGWCGFSQCGWDGVVFPSVDGIASLSVKHGEISRDQKNLQ